MLTLIELVTGAKLHVNKPMAMGYRKRIFQIKMEPKVNFVGTKNFAKFNVQEKAEIIRFFIERIYTLN